MLFASACDTVFLILLPRLSQRKNDDHVIEISLSREWLSASGEDGTQSPVYEMIEDYCALKPYKQQPVVS